ncbi:MAG: ABC transporter ATP-binding protein [Candidatus Kariarchaeaceae archaeon]|jgi:ABC-2 type transport system ATP-binding protein
MDPPIVEVSEVRKVYDSSPPIEALKSVTFSVKTGEIFGIIGVNGAGKTTLIRILTTMLQPTSGYTKVLGINPVEEPEKVRSLVGVLPQESGLYEDFTIRENLTFIGKMQGIPKLDLETKIEDICELLGLTDRLDNRVSTLSGGLKQRSMIARTLIGDPKILFLDEPTAGLDVLVARKVRQTIKSLSENMAIFLATHNMMEAYHLCDRIAVLNNGELSLIDTPLNIYNKNKVGDEDFEDVIAKLLRIDERSLVELEEET